MTRTAEPQPAAEPLSSPRGTPLTALGWADVRTRVAEAADFLLATTDPNGWPHVVPVLGVWLDGIPDTSTPWSRRGCSPSARRRGSAPPADASRSTDASRSEGDMARDHDDRQRMAILRHS